MQKTKKQKYEQEIRKSLKTIMNLDPDMIEFLKNLPLKNQNILSRTYSKLHEMQLLRTLTLLQINFIIFAFLDILEKTKAMKVQDLKIGIIGGGIIGRLITNTLLVFTKWLKTSNILVSTRQPHHLQFYSDNFGIKVFFDNDKIAEQAHIIFVATPATLDNWIILDLKNHIEKSKSNLYPVVESTRTSEASTVVIHNSLPMSNQNSVSIRDSLNKQLKSIALKKVQVPLNDNISINPFVYILTSDFTQQKSKKLFNFPVYVPHFRAKNLSFVIQKLRSNLQNIEISQLSDNPDKLMKQIQTIIAQEFFIQPENQNQEGQKVNQRSCLVQNFMKVLDFSCKQLENYWKKVNDNSKVKNSLQVFQIHKLYKDILLSQGSYKETFLTKSRKWRMAYNNFVA